MNLCENPYAVQGEIAVIIFLANGTLSSFAKQKGP